MSTTLATTTTDSLRERGSRGIAVEIANDAEAAEDEVRAAREPIEWPHERMEVWAFVPATKALTQRSRPLGHQERQHSPTQHRG